MESYISKVMDDYDGAIEGEDLDNPDMKIWIRDFIKQSIQESYEQGLEEGIQRQFDQIKADDEHWFKKINELEEWINYHYPADIPSGKILDKIQELRGIWKNLKLKDPIEEK